MAVRNGENYKKAYVDVPSSKIDKGEQIGRVRVAYDRFDLATIAAVLAVNDTVLGPKLPAGSKVLDAAVKSVSMGATGIFDFGWQANGVDAADPNGLVDQADAGGQAVYKLGSTPPVGPATAGVLKDFSVETQTELLVTEATANSTGVVEMFVWYVVD